MRKAGFSRGNEKSALGNTGTNIRLWNLGWWWRGRNWFGLNAGALAPPRHLFGDAIEGDPHFLCEREHRQIDDELLVGVNSSYFMLERSRSTLVARLSWICAEPRC